LLILGVSGYYHDSAAALVDEGRIIAAAQEERFSRIKHDSSFPYRAIEYCLKEAGRDLGDVDRVVFYDKPFLKFERLLETYIAFAPRGFKSFSKAMPIWLREKLFQKNMIATELNTLFRAVDWNDKLLFAEHHMSHAASAFYPSPFDDAMVLTMDGVGEWATTSAGFGDSNELRIEKEIHFPHSLGLLYSAFTYYTGFKVNSGEYKVMGLAPYGEPKFAQQIFDDIMDLKEDGSYKLNLSYFDYCTGLTMTSDKFDRLLGGPPRNPEEQLDQRHMDLASSVQAVTEEVMIRMTRSLASEGRSDNLCLAGGVALNCVANGKVLRDSKFKNIWVQPAAGDAGGALGAALAAHYQYFGSSRPRVNDSDEMSGAYLGPSFSTTDIEATLSELGADFVTLEDDELIRQTAEALASEKAVGWFQGRMEFGPRALGNRSILGDPRSESMQSLLNLKVKYRESFRPFAPSVLREHVSDWFELDADSPYMLVVADVRSDKRKTMTKEQDALFGIDKLNVPRSEIPAITHVDYSARVQTVHAETNPRYHQLISAFQELTGCPVLVNTSFNVRGEPLVCEPKDAFQCFMGTEIDMLVLGNCLLRKENQDAKLKINYAETFELD